MTFYACLYYFSIHCNIITILLSRKYLAFSCAFLGLKVRISSQMKWTELKIDFFRDTKRKRIFDCFTFPQKTYLPLTFKLVVILCAIVLKHIIESEVISFHFLCSTFGFYLTHMSFDWQDVGKVTIKGGTQEVYRRKKNHQERIL